jgi:cell division control protein 6
MTLRKETLSFFTQEIEKSKIKSKEIFTKYLETDSIFKDKTPFNLNFIPQHIPHREKEIEYLSHVLKPTLKIEKPSNLFIYGQSGTGKTLVVKNICETLKEVSKEQNIPLKIVYLNCRRGSVADTDYRLLSQICRFLGKEVPKTGISTKDVYDVFYNVIDSKKQVILLILDEIDNLVNKSGSTFLYNLSRIDDELELAKLSFIGISNNSSFTNYLDQRIKSSLTEEQIIFDPYDANQLFDILSERAKLALRPKKHTSGILRMISAIVAKENGDARKALNLLRVSAEICERKAAKKIEESHVREAEEKIEIDATEKTTKTLPKQTKLVLYSTILLSEENPSVYTGDIYDTYKKLANRLGEKALTKRRVSGLISDLDILGILNTKVISQGRHGRTRRTNINLNDEMIIRIKNLLQFDLSLK